MRGDFFCVRGYVDNIEVLKTDFEREVKRRKDFKCRFGCFLDVGFEAGGVKWFVFGYVRGGRVWIRCRFFDFCFWFLGFFVFFW